MRRAARGFTLLEVLVALAVVAIALAALTRSISANVSNAAYLRDRTLAHWVAMNKVTELQSGKEWPATGISDGEMLMAEREWHWAVTVSATPDKNIRRLDVAVRGVGEHEDVAKLIAYVGRTLQ